MKIVANTVCVLNVSVCTDFIGQLGGASHVPGGNLNLTNIPPMVCHVPAGSSVMNLMHWMQNIRNDSFSKFDYGEEGNMAHYGQPTPPSYNIGNLTMPIALFSGSQDALADPTDVQRLISELPPSSVVFQRNDEDYAHMDFTWGLDTQTRIYPIIVQLLKKAAQQA